jgi:hypothetical protein
VNYSNQQLDQVASVLGWALVLVLLAGAIVADCTTNQQRGAKVNNIQTQQKSEPISKISLLDHIQPTSITTDDLENQFSGSVGSDWEVWRRDRWVPIDTSAAPHLLKVWNQGDPLEDWKNSHQAGQTIAPPDVGDFLLDLLYKYQHSGIPTSRVASIFTEAERAISRDGDLRDLPTDRNTSLMRAIRQTEAVHTFHGVVASLLDVGAYFFADYLQVPRGKYTTVSGHDSGGLMEAPFTIRLLASACSHIIKDLERRIKLHNGGSITEGMTYDLCQYRRTRAVLRLFARDTTSSYDSRSLPRPVIAISVSAKKHISGREV